MRLFSKLPAGSVSLILSLAACGGVAVMARHHRLIPSKGLFPVWQPASR